MLLTSLITALLVPFVLAAPSPTPDNPEPPTGYSSVYNTCSGTANLYCCNGQGAGDTGDLPTDAQTGCINASVGNPPELDYKAGYCPATGGYIPLCCVTFVADQIVAGCDDPDQST